MYYQPVIFDVEQNSVNGVGLYRNNSISVFAGEDDDRQGGHYYVPDYLIKVKSVDETKYLIIDAKFSYIHSVRRFYVKDLAFKYLFSISPINDKDIIKGMCIMYGKCSEQDVMQSAYDKKLPNNDILPKAELIPLMESISNDEQYNKFDALFKMLLD